MLRPKIFPFAKEGNDGARNLKTGVVPMISRLPGTTLEVDLSRENAADALLSPMFLTGGLVLSQVAQLTGLEPYTIQNWVKRGFLPPPVKKKYSRRQLCRIFIINMLRDSMQIERICRLLSYVNGVSMTKGTILLTIPRCTYALSTWSPAWAASCLPPRCCHSGVTKRLRGMQSLMPARANAYASRWRSSPQPTWPPA